MYIALSCLMMRFGVERSRTRDQGEELTEVQGLAPKNGNSKDKDTAPKPYQDSRNQMKRSAIPAAQQKSIRNRRVSSGSSSGHSSQTPGGSNAKFWGQREHAGPSRSWLLHNKTKMDWPHVLHSESSFAAPMCLERTQSTSLQSTDMPPT